MKQGIETPNTSGLTIRRLREADAPAVHRLAQLDSATVPGGDLLGAEIEGRLVAVVSLTGDGAVADPFSRSGELRALLELRAAQLRARQDGKPGFALLRRRSGAAAAGAPTGAGGELPALQMRSY